MTILEKIKFEEDWLSEVNLTKENIKIALAGIRATVIEQQPCEDCISREAIMDLIDEMGDDFYSPREAVVSLDYMADAINELPSVTPQTRWIPCSERMPEELEPVNITWVNHNPESYYADIKDKPFTATGVYFNGQWYWWSTLCTDILAEYSHNYDDIIDDDVEITAWMPLPQPYTESEDEE